jgi:hypothetical protein
MSYILILVLGIGAGFGGTSQIRAFSYKTKAACELAGQTAANKLKQDISTATYVCIAKDSK